MKWFSLNTNIMNKNSRVLNNKKSYPKIHSFRSCERNKKRSNLMSVRDFWSIAGGECVVFKHNLISTQTDTHIWNWFLGLICRLIWFICFYIHSHLKASKLDSSATKSNSNWEQVRPQQIKHDTIFERLTWSSVECH